MQQNIDSDIRKIIRDINKSENESTNNINRVNEVSEIHIPLLYNRNNNRIIKREGNIIVGCPKQTIHYVG